MTEYRISVYYKRPLPQYFRNSLTTFLEEALEQGIIDGYEFNEYTQEEPSDVVKSAKKYSTGHDTGARERTKDSDDKGKTGGAGSEHKEIRGDRADSGKKEK